MRTVAAGLRPRRTDARAGPSGTTASAAAPARSGAGARVPDSAHAAAQARAYRSSTTPLPKVRVPASRSAVLVSDDGNMDLPRPIRTGWT